MNTLSTLDDRLLLAVNGLAVRTPAWHALVLGYATYGVALFAALLLTALVVARHGSSRDLAATGWAALAPLAALALNQWLGQLAAEPRPYVTHPSMLRLADVTTDFSFPSDHAVLAGAVAAGLLLAHRRLGLVAAAAALLMAFARVYVGAHYPWDVAAGLGVGALVAVLGWLLLAHPLTALTRWLRARPVLDRAFAERPPRLGVDAGPDPAATATEQAVVR